MKTRRSILAVGVQQRTPTPIAMDPNQPSTSASASIPRDSDSNGNWSNTKKSIGSTKLARTTHTPVRLDNVIVIEGELCVKSL